MEGVLSDSIELTITYIIKATVFKRHYGIVHTIRFPVDIKCESIKSYTYS